MKKINIINIILLISAILFMASPGGNGFLFANQSVGNDVKEAPTHITVTFPVREEKYLVELPAGDYGESERKIGFTRGLRAIFIRHSHLAHIMENPTIREALAKPDIYVKQFSYTVKNNINVSGVRSIFLRIKFEETAIAKLLQSTSDSLWVSNKPLTLLWLARDTQPGKVLGGDNDPLVHYVTHKSQEYALPVLLPLMDVQELNSICSRDVCKFDLHKIRQLSLRYEPTLIAVGCIRKSIFNGNLSGRWLLLRENRVEDFNLEAVDEKTLVSKALAILAEKATNVLTYVAGENSRLVLRVSGVTDYGQQNQLMGYLKSISRNVTQVELININASNVDLAVNVSGGIKVFSNILAGQSKLIPNPNGDELPPGIDLNYRWVVPGG